MNRSRAITIFAVFFLFAFAGCSSGGTEDDPCKGIDCSTHGTCKVVDGQPLCDCEDGYAVTPDGTKCLPGSTDPCRPYDCSLHGRCRLDDDENPYCDCDNGYWSGADGLDCIENNCTGDCGELGCCGNECCKLLPSNAADLGDFPTSGAAKTASGSFDTTAGCNAGTSLGDCELVTLAHSADVCVCRVGDLQINGLTVNGDAALAIFSSGTVTIGGTIDLSGSMRVPGPGAEAQPEDASLRLGGRGGSFGTAGGGGGEVRGTRQMVPLIGGQNGQNGCDGRSGGGGGGVMQVSAMGSITVTGNIHALGGGGQGGAASEQAATCCGGAGGGSGGGILLEAPEVTFSGSFWAHGGGGGGGGNNRGATGGDGQNATTSNTPAPGGAGRDGATCPLYEAIQGGDGGLGSVGDSPGSDGEPTDRNMCDPDQPYVGGGGGGGGSGRIRINTSATSQCNCSGSFSPSPSYGVINKG